MSGRVEAPTTTTLRRRTTGTRVVDGVEYPVEDLLRRVQMPHRARPQWFLVRGYCGGSTLDSRFAEAEVEEYKSLRAAQKAWDA